MVEVKLPRQAHGRQPLVVDLEDEGVDGGQDKARDDANPKKGGAEQEDSCDEERLGDPVRPVRIILPKQTMSDGRVDEYGRKSDQNTELDCIFTRRNMSRSRIAR
ncbi:hypothetical protein [Mesorhizobium sp.]|uniref:hypothetical protein n=1 Tax=Mesorhizobium sp. TaxID=1871066 RepID=UPI000FE47509|nr:hypothetical protein [Mesorhizobium sp.]RWD45220.1 MAG: hypothetical protein EOS35_14110 [Mesorhizobium sp.]TIX88205.1 MAG: hypothetical protein E5V21_00165 [Mesorhizobium sp.]TIY11245.1 MAG: hypothetical protein E5V16_06660 [Mesorhizobium sp.]